MNEMNIEDFISRVDACELSQIYCAGTVVPKEELLGWLRKARDADFARESAVEAYRKAHDKSLGRVIASLMKLRQGESHGT